MTGHGTPFTTLMSPHSWSLCTPGQGSRITSQHFQQHDTLASEHNRLARVCHAAPHNSHRRPPDIMPMQECRHAHRAAHRCGRSGGGRCWPHRRGASPAQSPGGPGGAPAARAWRSRAQRCICSCSTRQLFAISVWATVPEAWPEWCCRVPPDIYHNQQQWRQWRSRVRSRVVAGAGARQPHAGEAGVGVGGGDADGVVVVV